MTIYSDVLAVRISPAINALIDQAAAMHGQKASERVRQYIRTGLQLDGFDPATIPARDAGTLYDVVDGKSRWARIKDGEIHGLYYHAEKPDFAPGYVAVPVTHEDSEPFDPAQHWRQTPHDVLVVDYDDTPTRVIRTFPVVPKTEHA